MISKKAWGPVRDAEHCGWGGHTTVVVKVHPDGDLGVISYEDGQPYTVSPANVVSVHKIMEVLYKSKDARFDIEYEGQEPGQERVLEKIKLPGLTWHLTKLVWSSPG